MIETSSQTLYRMDTSPYALFFKTLSNETRIRIVHLLRGGPRNVTQICEELELEQSLVSHSLRCLANCGFVSVKQSGKSRYYYLDQEVILPILEFIDKHVERYREKLKGCAVLKDERR